MLNNKKELLNIEVNTFRVLHNLYQFDFEKEHKAIKHAGKFTINSLVKTYDLNLIDDKIVLLVGNVSGWENYLHLVELGYNNLIEIETKPHRSGIYNCKITDFISKKYFEEARKNENIVVWIIAQNVNLLSDKKQFVFVNNHRFKLLDTGYKTYNPTAKQSYYSKIKLFDTVNNKSIEYRPETKTDNINLIIDKSGYLIETERNKLYFKAKRLKSERLKNEFVTTDYSDQLNELSLISGKLKTKLIDVLYNNVFNFELLKNYNDLVFKIKYLQLDIERCNTKLLNKSYSSIAAADVEFNAIVNKVKEVLQ